ncbi:cell wall shape-determining protein [Erysipelotrichaceae bacterium]|nr:cell wall shape-determining protein [Erysipelotrichaceae bacterium]
MGIVNENEVNREQSLLSGLVQWKYIDKLSFFAVLILLSFSIIFVYSTTIYYSIFDSNWGNSPYDFVQKQILFSIIGITFYFIVQRIPIDYYIRNWKVILNTVVVLMVLPLFFEPRNGAHRWIALGSFTFQPSEVAKIALILLWSIACVTRMDDFKERFKVLKAKKAPMELFVRRIVKSWGEPVIYTLILLLLYRLQSDNGSAVISGALICILLFASGGLPAKASRVFWGIVVFLVGVLTAASTYFKNMDPKILVEWGKSNYVYGRFVSWINPFVDYDRMGFQLVNSLIAMSKGGLFGVGLGKGTQKKGHLPDGHTDFILANIVEEGGIFTLLILYTLYMVIILRGYKIARESKSRISMLAATGIASLFFIQACWNSAGIVGLLPLKGLPAPLLSSGGTSLIFMLVALGILQRVHIENQKGVTKKNEKNPRKIRENGKNPRKSYSKQ